MEPAGDIADTGVGLVVVFERLLPLVRQISTAGDLSMSAASVLARLARAGPQRLTDLAALQNVSQPAMTQLVSRLERDGLVRRTASAHDGRVVVVEVTAAGLELADLRRAERAKVLAELVGCLDPAERAAIGTALPALAKLASLAPAALPARRPLAALAAAAQPASR